MRTSGFPCRSLGCDQVFQVLDQRSMDALREASAARSAHEVSSHDYHHVSVATQTSYAPQWARPRPPVLPKPAPPRS